MGSKLISSCTWLILVRVVHPVATLMSAVFTVCNFCFCVANVKEDRIVQER